MSLRFYLFLPVFCWQHFFWDFYLDIIEMKQVSADFRFFYKKNIFIPLYLYLQLQKDHFIVHSSLV